MGKPKRITIPNKPGIADVLLSAVATAIEVAENAIDVAGKLQRAHSEAVEQLIKHGLVPPEDEGPLREICAAAAANIGAMKDALEPLRRRLAP